MDDHRVYNLRLCDNIFDARISAGMTQQAVADAIGMHRNQYQRLERGTHRIAVYDLVRIAEAIGCSVVGLLPMRAT